MIERADTIPPEPEEPQVDQVLPQPPAFVPGSAIGGTTGDDRGELGESHSSGDSSASGVDRPLTSRVEALLFASGQALPAARVARALGVATDAVAVALTELVARWQVREGAIELVEIAGGWRFMTRPDYYEDVAALRGKPGPEKLSPAALETLAVVAYRQPITRAAVEAVRGVQAGPVLRLLIEHDLIKIAGRSEEPGHPLLYGTTRRFLDHFGLASLDKLPDLKDVLESS
jgi:segregation and condensation protein B